MSKSYGISILNNSAYIALVEMVDDNFVLSDLLILRDKNIIDSLNKWFKKNKKNLNGTQYSINIPGIPIFKIANYQSDTGVSVEEAVKFELDNFLINIEEFTFTYELQNNSNLFIAATQRDKALDFLNSLLVKPKYVDLTILGLYNICEFLYDTTQAGVAVFYDKNEIVYIAFEDKKIVDYKQVKNEGELVDELKLYINEVSINPQKIYISGDSDLLAEFEDSTFTVDVEFIDIYEKIAVDEALKDNVYLKNNKQAFSIAVGFAIKPLILKG